MRGIDRIDEDEAPDLVPRQRQEPGPGPVLHPLLPRQLRRHRPGRADRGQRQPHRPATRRTASTSSTPTAAWTCRRSTSCGASSDGKLVCKLEEADISELQGSGWEPPEVFVAKGRDGKTDIWGIIARPREPRPDQEVPGRSSTIYAGPQGSYVPKTFSAARRFAALTDLGFIVVQMDGMGTAIRSKAFHDVCWHNLGDAGFPDRILWHKAAGGEVPVLRPDPRGHLRHLRRRPERGRRGALPPRVLQGRRRRLRLPRQPHGQGVVERAVDGLPGRPAVRRVAPTSTTPPSSAASCC